MQTTDCSHGKTIRWLTFVGYDMFTKTCYTITPYSKSTDGSIIVLIGMVKDAVLPGRRWSYLQE